MKHVMTISIGLGLAGLSSGCETAGFGRLSSTECMKMDNQIDQDSCYFDLVAEAAENNDMATCIKELTMIQDPLMRAAATRMLISRQPAGMDQLTATNLCEQLTESESEDCLRTWDRPHLWSGQ